MTNTLDIQTIDVLIDAKLSARSFPGLKVKPNQEDADAFDITHTFDHRFDRMCVPLHALVVQVADVKLELEAVYGEHAENLFNKPFHIEIAEPVEYK